MYFTVTEEWIKSNFTDRGGLTGAQLRTLGMVPMKLPKNWMKDIEGKQITIEEKEYFEGEAKHTFSKSYARQLRKQEVDCTFKREVVALQHYKTIEGIVYNRNWTPEFVASTAFLSTYEWAKTRMKVLATQGNWCRCCGAKPDRGAKICVDHIKPRLFFPELSLDPSNLQVLCELCNFGKGNVFAVDWRNPTPKLKKKKRNKRRKNN